MVQNAGFVSIGRGIGLISTSPEKSNNFEVFDVMFEMEVRKNIWQSYTKIQIYEIECWMWKWNAWLNL